MSGGADASLTPHPLTPNFSISIIKKNFLKKATRNSGIVVQALSSKDNPDLGEEGHRIAMGRQVKIHLYLRKDSKT